MRVTLLITSLAVASAYVASPIALGRGQSAFTPRLRVEAAAAHRASGASSIEMMAAKKSVGDLKKSELEGKKLLIRCDLILKNGARVAVSSHLGRPKSCPEDKFLLCPCAARLSELLGQDAAIRDALHKMLAKSKILESADDKVEEDDEASKPGKGKGKAAGKGAPQEAAAAVAVDAEVALDKAFKTIAAGKRLYALAAAQKEAESAAMEVDDMSDIWR